MHNSEQIFRTVVVWTTLKNKYEYSLMFEFKYWKFFFFISGRQQSRHLLHQPTSVRQRSTFRHRLSNRFTDSGQKVGLWTTKRSRNRYRRQGWWRSPSRDQVTVFLNTVTTRILNARLPDFYYFDIWIIKNSENVWKCPKQPFTGPMFKWQSDYCTKFGQVCTCTGRYQLPIFHCTNVHL